MAYESSYMPNFTLSLEGTKRLEFILKNFDKKMGKKTIRKAMREGAKPIVKQAKRNAPVSGRKTYLYEHRHISKGAETKKYTKHGSGELKRSIGVIPGRDGWSMYVGPKFGDRAMANDAWYAHFVEFGTDSTGWGKGIKKQPYMRPAWDMEKENAMNLIAKSLKMAVDEYFNSITKK